MYKLIFIITFLLCFFSCSESDAKKKIYFLGNQLGYEPSENKIFYMGTLDSTRIDKIKVFNSNQKNIYQVQAELLETTNIHQTPYKNHFSVDLSQIVTPGKYQIVLFDSLKLKSIHIKKNIYEPVVDSLLFFLSVARCGETNPKWHKPCHLNDSTEPQLDLVGGWHDAGDFLKFTSKEAYTTYLILRAYNNYMERIKTFSEKKKKRLNTLLNEAKIGIDYLHKVFPDTNTFVNQVGDPDMDHNQGTRLPENDKLAEKDRPAYLSFDEKTLGVYVSAMALGAKTMQVFDSVESKMILQKAKAAYLIKDKINLTHFDKWCLAALEIYEATQDSLFLEDAINYSERLNPARWGHRSDHTNFALLKLAKYRSSVLDKVKTSMNFFLQRSEDHFWGYCVDYTWASLYVAVSIASSARQYVEISGENEYMSLANNIKSYVLGFNPWAISFISGIGSRYPKNIHNSVAKALKNRKNITFAYIPGAIAEGPFSSLKWSENWTHLLSEYEDDLAHLQPEDCVYHDHPGDYVTNEPCIYGAAEAIYFFSHWLD